MATTPFGWVHAHRISLMGDCRDSVSVETYKKEHFWFLNKISDAEITREDIGGMSRELFEIYEQDIMTRMNRGEIKSAYELENSGVIYVDDYYRDDGTFVQGYYRRLPREYA